MALLHQAAGCPWHKLGPHSGLLLLDGVAVSSASIAMYKDALRKWEHLPHPAWEGFPIFWREGPEHAAAALSEQLRLMRWHVEFKWWETTQTVLHRFDNSADKLQSEGNIHSGTSILNVNPDVSVHHAAPVSHLDSPTTHSMLW